MTMPLTGVYTCRYLYTWSTYAILFIPNYRTAVGQLPNVAQHRIVNHSLHFVDPVTNVHTQHVESYWNRVKIKFKRMRGVDSNQLPSYLDEFMWFERYGKTRADRFDNIARDIAIQYPV